MLAGLAGCASLPGPGETVTVSAGPPITAQDLDTRREVAAARPALQAAGIGQAEIAAGRVLARNFERQPPAGGPPSEYLIVQGSWLVRCRR